MDRVRVIVAEDHTICVEGMLSALSRNHDMMIVGHLRDRTRLVDAAREERPDIILLDLMMEDGCDVVEVLQSLRRLTKPPHILIVSGRYEPFLMDSAAELGVAGYLLKEDDLPALLPGAIRQVCEGGFATSPTVKELCRSAHAIRQGYGLSADQVEVLARLVAGDKVPQIREKLGKPSDEAVRSSIKRIRYKLDVSTTVQAVAKAIREDIVPLR